MEAPLKVLILEDNPADAELAAAELRSAGLSIDWRRVETERDYLAALEMDLDLVLADHSLPQYDSVRALDALQKRGLDVPFIVVSGAIDEELAVTLMQKGAADYVIKDRRARLGQAALQALQKRRLRRDKRRIEQALNDSDAWHRALVENSQDAIVVLDGDGMIRFASGSMTRLMGFTAKELLGESSFGWIHPDDVAAARSKIEDLRRHPGMISMNCYRARHKDGSWRWLDVIFTSLIDKPPVNGIVVNLRDVTERQQAEDSLRLFRTLLDRSNDAIEIVDPETGRFLDVNDKACTSHGYTREEFLRMTVLDVEETIAHWPPPTLSEAQQMAGFFIVEGRHRRKDGSTFPVEVNVNAIHLERDYIVAVVRDITERKQAEAAIRESDRAKAKLLEKLVEAQHSAAIGSWEWDLLTKQVWWSEETYRLFGVAPQEYVPTFEANGKFIHPDDHELYVKSFEHSLQTGEPCQFDIRIMARDGVLKHCHARWTTHTDDSGKLVRLAGTIMDITDRKRAEEQLQLQAAALEAAANSIVITDRQGDIVWVNNAFTRLTGYTFAEVRGKNPRVLKSGKQDPAYYEHLWSTIIAGKVWHGELINRRKDGDLYTEELTVTPVRATGDGITHFIAIKQDVTERKRTELALRDSEERFRRITTNMLDLVVQVNAEGIYEYVTPSTLAVLGYRPEDLLGHSFFPLMHPGDLDRAVASFKNAMATGAPTSGEYRFRKADGEYLWLEVVGTRLLDDHGQLCGGLIACRDITARRRAEDEIHQLNAELEQKVRDRTAQLEAANKELQEQEEDLSAVLTASPEAIGVIDVRTGLFKKLNPQAERLFGLRCAELEKVGPAEVSPEFQPDGSPSLSAAQQKIRAAQLGQRPVFEWTHRHADGNLIPCEVRLAALPAPRDHLVRFSVTDITERKRSEEAMLKLNVQLDHGKAALEDANRELESFAYSVSHDLRAPLRGIDGFSQALLEDYHDKLDAGGQDCLRRVRAASQRMGQLIDDLLQLSRMTRSTMTLAEVDLTMLAKRAIAELQVADPARRVEVRVAPGLTANGDARLLEVVLVNLLGNAWKFTSKTEGASIEFGVTQHEGTRTFYVRDNGAGFDMAHAGRLFGAFQRLHSDAEFPGTGIGLATVQRIIRRHGGRVWADGAVGKGATFFFTLGDTATGRNSHA